MRILLLSLLVVAAPLRADFDAALWKLRRPIAVASNADVCSFRIDATLYRGMAADQADLRVIRGPVETPYAITTLAGFSRETELRPAIIDQGVVPQTGVRVTLDIGRAVKHNRLRIATNEHNFRKRVRIETADKPGEWTIVRDDGYIFDFSQGDVQQSVLSVDYPVSTKRYVRATVFGWTDIHAIESAWLTWYEHQDPVRDVMASLRPARVEDGKTKSTLLRVDLGAAGLPHNEARFAVGPGYFYRSVQIETSSDGEDWNYLAQGVLSRTPDREDLSIDFPENRDRYLRARIYNRDDAPLQVASVELTAFERVVSFPAKDAGAYQVYYGNPEAKKPSYDFGLVFEREGNPPVVNASLGREEANPAYHPPPPPAKPWTDQHPWLLYAILGAAVVVMGSVTVRLLMKVGGS